MYQQPDYCNPGNLVLTELNPLACRPLKHTKAVGKGGQIAPKERKDRSVVQGSPPLRSWGRLENVSVVTQVLLYSNNTVLESRFSVITEPLQ